MGAKRGPEGFSRREQHVVRVNDKDSLGHIEADNSYKSLGGQRMKHQIVVEAYKAAPPDSSDGHFRISKTSVFREFIGRRNIIGWRRSPAKLDALVEVSMERAKDALIGVIFKANPSLRTGSTEFIDKETLLERESAKTSTREDVPVRSSV